MNHTYGHNLPKNWVELVDTACYVLNHILIRPILNKTCYELFFDRISKVSYPKVFGCKCFLLNTRDNLYKFVARSVEGTFVGYSTKSKAHRIFNKKTSTIEESLHVTFDESLPKSSHDICIDDDIIDSAPIDASIDISHDNTNMSNKFKIFSNLLKAFIEVRDHPHDLVI